eukprot:SAG11_NODE_2875_length_2880_cov_1.568141_2_plen_66_part_00
MSTGAQALFIGVMDMQLAGMQIATAIVEWSIGDRCNTDALVHVVGGIGMVRALAHALVFAHCRWC